MFRSIFKTKQLALNVNDRARNDDSVSALKDWDDVFELNFSGTIYDQYYKVYYNEFLAWNKNHNSNITDVNRLVGIFNSEKKPDLLLLGKDGKIKFLHNIHVSIPNLIDFPNIIHISGISQRSFLSPVISVDTSDGIDFLDVSTTKVPFVKGAEQEKATINDRFKTNDKSEIKKGGISIPEESKPSSPLLIPGFEYAENTVTPNLTQTTGVTVPESEIQQEQPTISPWYKAVGEEVRKLLLPSNDTPKSRDPTTTFFWWTRRTSTMSSTTLSSAPRSSHLSSSKRQRTIGLVWAQPHPLHRQCQRQEDFLSLCLETSLATQKLPLRQSLHQICQTYPHVFASRPKWNRHGVQLQRVRGP
jgi:hypothetical protein